MPERFPVRRPFSQTTFVPWRGGRVERTSRSWQVHPLVVVCGAAPRLPVDVAYSRAACGRRTVVRTFSLARRILVCLGYSFDEVEFMEVAARAAPETFGIPESDRCWSLEGLDNLGP
ncbi:MAG: hypothetical protein VX488_07960 [Actinomycetota bacterium]|nr:hypothetical protein [Actinomycetota bacterium]